MQMTHRPYDCEISRIRPSAVVRCVAVNSEEDDASLSPPLGVKVGHRVGTSHWIFSQIDCGVTRRRWPDALHHGTDTTRALSIQRGKIRLGWPPLR